jgi:hypothetical protein
MLRAKKDISIIFSIFSFSGALRLSSAKIIDITFLEMEEIKEVYCS